MKNNYPVKYGLMPISTPSNFIQNYQEKIEFYIVCKCFVINEIKTYLKSGKQECKYEVVFAYQRDYENYDIWKRIEPEFSCNKECINSNITDRIYTSYESALSSASSLNNELFYDKIRCLPNNELREQELLKLLQKNSSDNSKYKALEKNIKSATNDLVINEYAKEQSIIIKRKDKDVIAKISLYDWLNLYFSDKFYVCTVTNSEYELMKKQITEDGILEERITELPSYQTNRYLLASNPNKKIVEIMNYKHPTKVGNFYLEESTILGQQNMKYDSNLPSFINDSNLVIDDTYIKIYTQEDYRDVIKSYIPYYKDFDEVKTPIIDNINLTNNISIKKLERRR